MGQQRRLRAKSLYSIVAGVVLLILASAAPAGAATWTARQLSEVGQAPFFDISCPSTSLCVAVGGGNTLASSADPTGPAAGWSVAYPGGAGPPQSERDQGRLLPLAPALRRRQLRRARPHLDKPDRRARGVEHRRPQSQRSPHPPLRSLLPLADLLRCLGRRRQDPHLHQPHRRRRGLGGDSATGPARTARHLLCLALVLRRGRRRRRKHQARANRSRRDLARPTRSPAPGNRPSPRLAGQAFGVSCPSPALCVSGNAPATLVASTRSHRPGLAWPGHGGGGSVQLTAAACPRVSRCVAVDNNADVLTSTDPTGGPGAWTFTNLIPYTQIVGTIASNAMWGVSCPTVSFCAISAGDGQVFTGETRSRPAGAGQERGRERRRRGAERAETAPRLSPDVPYRRSSSIAASSRSALASSPRTTLRSGASPAGSTSDRWRAVAPRSAIASGAGGTAFGFARSAGAG